MKFIYYEKKCKRRNCLFKVSSQLIEKFMIYQQVIGKVLQIFITLCIELQNNDVLPLSLTDTLDLVTRSFEIKITSIAT